MIHRQLPGAQIYYMSIKPSPSRAKYFDDMTKANQLIKYYLANKPKSTYIDMGTVIFKNNSSIPDSSLFKADYLHLNGKGYDKWQKVLEPYVE
jgi:lysophospholipase L1-like esterase